MVVPKKRHKAGVVELTGYYAVVFCAVAEGEGYEVALEVIVAAHRSIRRDDQQLLVFRPPQTFDCAFVPLSTVSAMFYRLSRHTWSSHTLMLRISLPAQLYMSMLDLDAPGPRYVCSFSSSR
jgi:hypothetical protein